MEKVGTLIYKKGKKYEVTAGAGKGILKKGCTDTKIEAEALALKFRKELEAV